MHPLIRLGLLTLEAMFVIGGFGTAVVLIFVGFEVFRTLLEPGEEEES